MTAPSRSRRSPPPLTDGTLRLADNFEITIARDEVLNDYRTGPAILRELLRRATPSGDKVEVFNEWVYEEVFRAPLSDPWLGLAPEDIYTVLPAETRTAERRPQR